jgi:hypothetical protein
MEYVWLRNKAGRKKDRREILNPANPTVGRWLNWGWISPVEAPKPPPVAAVAMDAPPVSKEVKRAPKKKEVTDDGDHDGDES